MDGPTIRLMPGERRQQRVRIYGCDPSATVVVQSASWELHRVKGDVVSQGACVITDNNLLTFTLSVDDPGRYHLLITAMIGPEIYKTAAGVIAYDCC